MVQNLQMAWVVVATCEVHYEAVKSQTKDGWRGGGGACIFETIMEGAKPSQTGKRVVGDISG